MTIPRTVIVLGAGFTKAFLDHAPVLVDEYGVEELEQKFAEFPHALNVLCWERDQCEREGNTPGKIDLERLMTRLDGQMPYDIGSGASDVLALLLREIKQSFIKRVDAAKTGPNAVEELIPLARFCVDNAVTCITFNYDDILDEVLYRERKPPFPHEPDVPNWHPDGGYGFFCRPSLSCIREGASVLMDKATMLLLKLHGSMNWRVRHGHPEPYVVEALVHHEPWSHFEGVYFSQFERSGPDGVDFDERVSLHLEPDPFIVPPVLIKSAIVEQPILRVVWSLAFQELADAERVIFVGYSMPVTDIAARFLFGEALRNLPVTHIKVVNFARDIAERNTVVNAYRKVFPDLGRNQFDFRGARVWAQEFSQHVDSESGRKRRKGPVRGSAPRE